jgi:glutaredoxin-like protein
MLLSDSDRRTIEDRLKPMPGPVRLLNFTQELECQFCRDTRELVEELARLSDKLTLETYNFLLDKEQVSQYSVDRIPAIVVAGDKDHGIRFYGIPSGYEFAGLLEIILCVSHGDSGLRPGTLDRLQALTHPVHLQVFVTPTCPHCPLTVLLAHQLALASDLVSADMVEATEFPELSYRYGVRSVPHTVVNGEVSIVGGVPEDDYVKRIIESSCAGSSEERRTAPKNHMAPRTDANGDH